MSGKQKMFTLTIAMVFALYPVLALPVQASSDFVFNKNLQAGNAHADVRELQKFLNSNGFALNAYGVGSSGQETTFFGPATKRALINFQKAKGITPAVGYFGPISRHAINGIIIASVMSPAPSVNQGGDNQPVGQVVGQAGQNDKGGYYSIGGRITGITGAVVLQNNGKDDLTIDIGHDSNFAFPVAVADGTGYSVTARSKYSDQACYVHKNIGTVSGADIESVRIACGANLSRNPFTHVFSGGVSSYHLVYVAGAGGTISGAVSQTVNSGSSGSAVTAVPDTGYSFVSWSDGVLTAARTDASVAADKSVSATFAINTYIVTFDTNGGDGGSTAAQTLDYNTPTVLTTNGFTNTGYVFAGWATTSGGAAAYADGASYTIGTDNVTLFAKWIIDAPSTLSYDAPDLFVAGTAISTLSPTVMGTVDNYSISPALPAGLSLDTGNGQISGTPAAGTTQSIYTVSATNAGGSATFDLVLMVDGTVVGANGKIWLDRNLGATQVATSSDDYLAYGDLFQWGRPADGHQLITRTSSSAGTGTNGTQSGRVASVVPGTDTFIVTGIFDTDWSSIDSDGAIRSENWGSDGSSNPCPTGYRLPTEAEWTAEKGSWSSNNSTGAFASSLKLTLAGYRIYSGTLVNIGTGGYYWSRTVDGDKVHSMVFYGSDAYIGSEDRPSGFTARCIENAYVVTFDANGGTGSTSAQTLDYDTPTALTTNGFTNTGYIFAGWATTSGGAVAYADGALFTIGDGDVTLFAKWDTAPVVGASFRGGKVAYILQAGNPGYVAGQTHGLIAATVDQSSSIVWAKAAFQSAAVPGGTSFAIGSGSANTDKIINQNGLDGTYAAGIARAYAGGGYHDWYLPSRDEIDKLFINRAAIGGFGAAYYWSSSEESATTAVSRHFEVDCYSMKTKGTLYTYVRAVRSF